MCWKRLQGLTSPEIELQGRATPISQGPQTSRMCTFAASPSDSLAVGLGSIPVAPTGPADDRFRRNLVITGRFGEGPFTIRFADFW